MNQIVKVYLKIRDKRTELRKEYTEADGKMRAQQDRLEAEMLRFLSQNEMDSVRTEAGTFYRQEDIKPAAKDWDAFYKWIVEKDAFEALEKRVKKQFITEYMEAHDGELPPGVSVYREYVARVRRT